LAALQINPYIEPKSYWENTSHNGIIRRFIDRDDLWEEEHINDDFETLLDGGFIIKKITENLTYDMLHSSANNLWSLLFLTGYLTQVSPGELHEEKSYRKQGELHFEFQMRKSKGCSGVLFLNGLRQRLSLLTEVICLRHCGTERNRNAPDSCHGWFLKRLAFMITKRIFIMLLLQESFLLQGTK